MAKGKEKSKSDNEQVIEDLGAIAPRGHDADIAPMITIGDKQFALEQWCNYKVVLAAKTIMGKANKVDLAPIIHLMMALQDPKEKGKITKSDFAGVLGHLAKQILTYIPESLTHLAAISLCSNAELRQAYRKPNGVAEIIAQYEELIDLDGYPGLGMEVVNLSIPLIGLESLKKALGDLVANLSRNIVPPETG